MGTETEFGISVVGSPHANPMVASTRLVNAYATSTLKARRARWDFEEETPLRDARGYELSRTLADPSQLTDEDLGLANVILTNGARLYVDHAHPEYSTPECTNPRDVVLWDKAGEMIALDAARLASVPDQPDLVLYKNNTDNKGASYGAHENYLVKRETPFSDLVRHLIPFFVSRQVVCGAGRVGIGQDGTQTGYQISQRADFFEVEVGLETTLKRPIINTRDEPHADPEKYRRLHVIIGDANMSEYSNLLKVGTTSLVLAMVESGYPLPNLELVTPVAALKQISHDPTLKATVSLKDGRELSGLDLQRVYLNLALDFAGSNPDPATVEVLQLWQEVLDRLQVDLFSCADLLDWVAKLRLLRSFRERDGLSWGDAKLQLIDLQYHDIRPEKGLYLRLLQSNRFQRLLTDAEIERAMHEPPSDTRAYFRGRCLSQYPDNVAAASWDSVIFDLPGYDSLQRIPTMDPLRGGQQQVADLLDRHPSALGLFEELTRG